jgi:hypothetical protein
MQFKCKLLLQESCTIPTPIFVNPIVNASSSADKIEHVIIVRALCSLGVGLLKEE